jgi:hypothetical protein
MISPYRILDMIAEPLTPWIDRGATPPGAMDIDDATWTSSGKGAASSYGSRRM